MHPRKIKLLSFITLGLILYLLFFSIFALSHAYINNELSDPQGCSIGLWVQHGQQVLLASFVLAVYFLLILQTRINQLPGFLSSVLKNLSTRAPPFQTSF